ncbi:pantothenate transporter [Aspergillus aculeatinus CBS 121060]|uniref:Pantothenate transporter n=1 Tax=Aspergillus aculeatinus CBS 121060 TaxID=1448322 RepID=A0ACD1H1R1_9EURO|nr:pantothenate transporter [Aspergillus aculeatinus CBS 121060]RAH67308.1 pantothenate transporter [Aspergillus aculeatinus CBS 121060]
MLSDASDDGHVQPARTAGSEDAKEVFINEKPIPGRDYVHQVNRNADTTIPDNGEAIPGYDAELMRERAALSADEEKKLLRRVDWHLIPLLAVIYMLKSVDFTNVSYALTMDKGTPHNILTELGMTKDQYNLVTAMYYIPYIIAEAPSNLLIKGVRPSVWQARIQVSWGTVLCCHAAVRNRQGLYAVRFFLGLFEAGLWPGMLVQLCYWYRPDEIAPRIVLVTLLGNFSTVISGVLAFAFNGVTTGGLSGWKWLILTEGIITIVLGVLTYVFLPDFPSTSSWLSETEQAFIQARLPRNSPRAQESNFNLRELINTLRNERIWLFLLCWAFFTVGTTGLTFYQPTVIANLGFTSMGESLLLNIPSAVFAVILTLAFGVFADTGRIPQPAIPLAFMIVIEACYGVLYAFPNSGGVYAATIIAGGFSTAWYVMMWPWRVQTTQGATGSAFAIAFANSYGQIGGAVGSQLFNSRYAPRYTTSFGIAMGFVGMAIIMNLITWGRTWKVDVDTRRLKRVRRAAAKENQAVLEDIDFR